MASLILERTLIFHPFLEAGKIILKTNIESIQKINMGPSSLQIFLLRHGQTEWTVSGQHTSSTDIPLTEEGKRQALSLKYRIEKITFDAVFCSPMKRSLDTCHLAGFKNPLIEPDAKEWNYGQYEGLTTEKIHQANPSWDLFAQGSPGGEKPEEVARRADRMIELFLRHQGKIALFSHGHFLRVLAARWIHLSVDKGKLFALSVASVSILGFEHQKQHVLQVWNDTHHLEM